MKWKGALRRKLDEKRERDREFKKIEQKEYAKAIKREMTQRAIDKARTRAKSDAIPLTQKIGKAMDSFLGPPRKRPAKKKGKKSGQKFVVVGGKAYPLASSGKTSRKKRPKRQRPPSIW